MEHDRSIMLDYLDQDETEIRTISVDSPRANVKRINEALAANKAVPELVKQRRKMDIVSNMEEKR